MGQTLTQIAQQLSTPRHVIKTVTEEKKTIPPTKVEEIKPIPKAQLIYAFNGIGKTRLSREFKELVAPKASTADEDDDAADQPSAFHNIIYYSAFTEDLFYWDNDLKDDIQRRLNGKTCFRPPRKIR